MKKVIAVILSVSVLSLSLAACGSKKANENGVVPASNNTEIVETTPATADTTPQPAANDKALELAREGKVTGLKIGIGSTLQDAIAELGEPAVMDYFEGTSFASYEVVDFILDRIVEDTKTEAYISGIILSEGYEVYGVKVGMSPAQIKAALGAPSKEGLETDSEGDMWRLDYECGDYLLSFFSVDKDSATLSAYLSKKQ